MKSIINASQSCTTPISISELIKKFKINIFNFNINLPSWKSNKIPKLNINYSLSGTWYSEFRYNSRNRGLCIERQYMIITQDNSSFHAKTIVYKHFPQELNGTIQDRRIIHGDYCNEKGFYFGKFMFIIDSNGNYIKGKWMAPCIIKDDVICEDWVLKKVDDFTISSKERIDSLNIKINKKEPILDINNN